MDVGQFGKWVFYFGLFIAVIGALIYFGSRMGLPLGRLPGDISIRRPGFSFHFPLATSIILSIVLTVLLNVILRLFHR